MSRPSELPTWDTTGTNVVEATSGHKADGYGLDEVPSSGEINWYLQLVYLWVQYLSAFVGIEPFWMYPHGIVNTDPSHITDIVVSSGTFLQFDGNAAGGSIEVIAISPPVGTSMTSISLRYACFGAAVTVDLYRSAGDSQDLVVSLNSWADTPSSGATFETIAGSPFGSPIEIADGYSYFFRIAFTGFGGSTFFRIAALGYTLGPA